VRVGLALLERIGTMLQTLTALLTPFAPPFHALALTLQPFAAPLLPVRDALDRGRLGVPWMPGRLGRARLVGQWQRRGSGVLALGHDRRSDGN